MTGKVVAIRRRTPRGGLDEEPQSTSRGYKLGDPAKGRLKHHAKNAVYVDTINQAAELIERGFSIWMGRPGMRPSLIAPDSIHVIRA